MCSFMINEKDVVRNMLECVKNIQPDEIVVVDEFSTDGTREILKEYNVKLIDGKLENNYSQIRNLCISNATKDWIMFIDADEILEASLCDVLFNREFLKFCDSVGIDMVAFKRKNYIDGIFQNQSYPDYQYRLFRNNGKIKYIRPIHEGPTGFIKKFESNYHIIHSKTNDRQQMQNRKYNKIYRQHGISHLINPNYD